VDPILHDMPADPADVEDMIHAYLLKGQPQKALIPSATLDCWLSAHMADLMFPLDLFDDTSDEK